MSCPGSHSFTGVAFLPAGTIGPQAFLSDLKFPHDTPGTADEAAKSLEPPPEHGHDCLVRGQRCVGWLHLAWLGQTLSREEVGCVPDPTSLVRLTKDPAL